LALADTYELQLLTEKLAVCRLDSDAGIPFWCVQSEPMLSVTRTRDELSIVCAEHLVPDWVHAERGFAALRVVGTIEFGVTGVMAALTRPLADAGISVFAISTYDTDYLLFRQTARERVVDVLTRSGFTFT
jgi:hypothetical protein